MAGAEKSYSEDQFSCSVCLDILKEPVTIPCGHSYCMRCVNNFWSALDQNAVHSCPQCRETFSPRPALKKNTLLAEVIEKMKNASDQASTSNQINLRCVKMECDFCIGTKNKADKFCLQCLASYCELHLQPHYESPAFAKHKLVPASAQMKKNICFHHGKLLDIYCCDDQQCICYLCMVESHNKHNTLSVESVRIKNQDSLERTKIKCQQMIAQRQEGLVEINRVKKSIMCFGQAAEEDSERIFTELIDSMRTRCSEVKELIRAQKQAELNRAEDLRQRLDRELEELRARMAEIEQLLASNDHIHFIKKCNSVSALPRFKALPSTTCQLDESSKNISMAVLKEHLEDVCQQEVARIAREVMNIHALEPAEPKTRQDFLRYFCDLHLDPNTVHKNLHLSQGDKKVNRVLEAPPKGFTTLSLSCQCFAQEAQENNDRTFTELIDSMKRRCSEKYTSFCAMPMYKDLPTINCLTRDTSGILSISGFKKYLEDVCEEEVARISKQVKHIYVVERPEPETREDFLQCEHDQLKQKTLLSCFTTSSYDGPAFSDRLSLTSYTRPMR
ncbi:hypothetical protein KOW79_014516 [Hemibagrus wyckioides]|uniref:E3 ubiquitin/ISG15 ligase TRIM25-like n=1 Tax=Hemibagrus wyckioides TaxID=337641 RepID=A0A9D3NI08_9TELE|nr:hypothetical protein KOW79_014516 [Hemibagrus wyckioides]